MEVIYFDGTWNHRTRRAYRNKVRGEKGDENRTQNSEDGKIGQGKEENQNYCTDKNFRYALTLFFDSPTPFTGT